MVRQIKAFAPDVFCLTDSDLCPVDLPQLRYPVMAISQADAIAIPQIDSRQRVAVVFTSGSTGIPQPHPKTWGALVSCVQAEALHLGLLHDTPCTIVGTVPPQHMYGFESTVLMRVAQRQRAQPCAAVLSGRHLRGARGRARAAGAGVLARASARLARCGAGAAGDRAGGMRHCARCLPDSRRKSRRVAMLR